MADPKQLTIMQGELGVKEKPGKAANPRILEYFEAAGSNVSSDEIAWCSALMCWVIEKAGYPSTNNTAARSWLKWGKSCDPKPGAVGVMPRGDSAWQGHVVMVEKVLGASVQCIGGNQSNAVTRKTYPIKAFLGFREPSTLMNSRTVAAQVMGLISTGAVAVGTAVSNNAQTVKDTAETAQGAAEQASYVWPVMTWVFIGCIVVASIATILIKKSDQKVKG